MTDELDLLYDELMLDRQTKVGVGPPWQGREYNRWYHSMWTWSHRKNKNKTDIFFYDQEGKIHRLAGPAYQSGCIKCEMWFKHGILHRDSGPAVVYKQNSIWYTDGKLSRLDGPAVVDVAGPKEYWIAGERFSPKQYKWEINRRRRKGLIE
jgi:hypothetical protein